MHVLCDCHIGDYYDDEHWWMWYWWWWWALESISDDDEYWLNQPTCSEISGKAIVTFEMRPNKRGISGIWPTVAVVTKLLGACGGWWGLEGGLVGAWQTVVVTGEGLRGGLRGGLADCCGDKIQLVGADQKILHWGCLTRLHKLFGFRKLYNLTRRLKKEKPNSGWSQNWCQSVTIVMMCGYQAMIRVICRMDWSIDRLCSVAVKEVKEGRGGEIWSSGFRGGVILLIMKIVIIMDRCYF